MCERCFKACRKCEGYSTYPIFINRGQGGFLKRAHLEEAKVANYDLVHLNGALPRPPDISCQTPQEDQLIATFWEEYVAGKGKGLNAASDEPAWLSAGINMPSKAGVLREALLAIAWTRAGRRHDDTPCIIQGQRCYGNALRMMQHALYDPELAQSDEVLVSARCMCLYEAFEATTGSLTSWINQSLGMSRIIELQGPEKCQQILPRAILESMRQNLMIVSHITRTKSFLASDDWRHIPWEGSEKPLEQRLYDHGFTLGCLFHTSDTMVPGQEVSSTVQANMFREIRDAYHSLAMLNEDLIHMQRTRFDTLKPTAVPVFTATLFGIDLGFSIFSSVLLERTSPSILEENNQVIQDLIEYTYGHRRKELARRILHYTVKCLETESLSVASQLVFALTCAYFELRDSIEDCNQVMSIMTVLEAENSHRIVGSLRRAGKSLLPRIMQSAVAEETGGPEPS